MSKVFDATTRHLLEVDPRAWLALVGVQTTAPVELINSDLSTITTEADKVIRIIEERPWLVHLELQSSHDPALPLRLARYNILLQYRHRLPVLSVVILLRSEADGQGLGGVLDSHLPDGTGYLTFRYRVLRVWQESVEQILQGGLATLPLAPLADLSADRLAGVVAQIDERLSKETSAEQANELWTSTFLLMGLRYPEEFSYQLLQAVRNMNESSTYQAILQKGRAEGRVEGQTEVAKRILFLLGRRRFGPPTMEVRTAIEAIADVDQLEELTERLLDVADWDTLLAS